MPGRRDSKPRRRRAKPVAGPRLRKEIKKVIHGEAETKMRTWYSGLTQSGTYAQRGWQPQDQNVQSNTTDIQRVIPVVVEGTDNWERIGTQIEPKSLVVHGNLAINYLNSLQLGVETNLYAVLYVLQHRYLKNYTTLIQDNDFTTLLNDGEGLSVPYTGLASDADLPVNAQNYILLQKKIIPLRYAGEFSSGTPVGTFGSVANSHNFCARFKLNLTKHLPKRLKYPIQTQLDSSGNPVSTVGKNDPNNSSLFFAVGFYYMNQQNVGSGAQASRLALNYTSVMKFKDL